VCGILGSFSHLSNDGDVHLIQRGLAAMEHRGPDGQGLEVFNTQHGSLVLAHGRLAIIDLSEAGRQPIQSHCGRFVMTFNGEIYNYIEIRRELSALGVLFNTATDSEVLLAAWVRWGENCLSRFDGMFAFAIFDKVSDTLYCANDPFGIKPLYYSQSQGRFTFSSEIPALLEVTKVKKALNVQSATSFLLWGTHDQGHETFVSSIQRLKPGHIMEYSLREKAIRHIKRWWKPNINLNDTYTFDDAAEVLRSLFLSSVRMQLRSDVPVGFSLSGGLDSSAIVCAARHLEPDYPIRTFTYVASSDALNERRWADVVNDHVDAQAHYVFDTDGDFDLDAGMLSQGEPFGSTSILAGLHLCQRMRSEGVIVSLDGQGADECLAGYDGYPSAILRERLDCGDYIGAANFLNEWSKWPGRNRSAMIQVLGDLIVPDFMRSWAINFAGYDTTPGWLKAKELHRLGISCGVPSAIPVSAENKGRRLAERLHISLTEVGLPRLLRYADRSSMHSSIEARVPFLSPALSEFLLTMPSEYLVSSNGQTKHLFRKAMRGIVPDEILNRRDKIGFETPERDLLNANRTRVNEWIQAAESVPFLDAGEVRKTVDAYLNKEVPYQGRCWRLINFCRWYSLLGMAV
jgi:asparagine synthase (glutamine-hydrolysing)